ncbi:hypothetical protein BDW74DRAFT_162263 [Aspergillus multicolor]|uniref:pentatricopeptide repeat protein n=1 Tax=Aspergillus multicolor TaxID=41759 RepID=UPI003CCDDA4A
MSAHGPPAVPSRNALRVLRSLALAGSTVGSFCTVAAITYDVHRRVSVAERIVENKRALQTSAPRYDATSAARRISRMMDAAEAGEFAGLEAWKETEKQYNQKANIDITYDTKGSSGGSLPERADDANTQATSDVATEHATKPKYRKKIFKGVELNPKPEIFTEVALQPRQLKSKAVPPSQPPPPSVKAIYRVRQVDSEANTTTITCDIDSRLGEQLTLDQRLEGYIERGRYIDAAQIFLDEHPASNEWISIHRRQIVEQLFYLNCRQENVFIARSLFERLEEVDRVSPTMWKVLIVSLAKNGCIESATTVYLRYKDKFPLPGILLDVVLRCLIESRRLQAAKNLLFQNLEHDIECGLCGAYLSGLWKKARSIELLNGQFTKLLIMLRRLDKKPTFKIVHPMLKAYVDFGRFADAETLLHQMTVAYQIPLNVRLKGIMVYGKALQCDWEAVDQGLDEMQSLGLTESKRDFVRIFHRIFLEYWPVHSAAEIRQFLFRYIDKFDIVPDDILWGHILEAVVERGDMAMLHEFLAMAQQRRWKVATNQDDVLRVVNRRQTVLGGSPVGFWQMLHAARADNMRATASQQLLGLDQRTEWRKPDITVATGFEKADDADTWFERTVDELTRPSRSVDDYQNLQTQMIHFMHSGKMAEALQAFQSAWESGFVLKPREVELALIARLLSQGLGAAQALLETEPKWVPWLPIFFRQLKDINPSAESEYTQIAVFRFYRIRWARGTLMVTHNLTAATSARLIASNKSEMAIDLLVSVYKSKYGRLKRLDAVCMKMFMRAFAATENYRGVRWCILTALSRDSALSRDFLVEAQRVLGVMRRELVGVVMEDATSRLPELSAIDQLVEFLRMKYEGGWFQPGTLSFSAHWKHLNRQTLKQPFSKDVWQKTPTMTNKGIKKLQALTNRWDEEYELERVLDSIDNDEESVIARWNEATCREQDLELEPKDSEAVHDSQSQYSV